MVYLKVFELAYGEILSDVQARWSIQFRPLNPQFRADLFGDRVLVDHDVDGLRADVAFRHVQVAAESIALSAPRVFGDVIFRAVLVFGDTSEVHQVIVGRHEALIACLADLRRYVHLRKGFLELIDLLQALFLVEFLEAGPVGCRVVVDILHLRVDRYAILEGEALLAHVAIPADRVAMCQGIVGHGHHLVERQVIHALVLPVVGHLDLEFLVIGMMREAGQLDVVRHVQPQRLGECFRGVLLALVGEGLRQLAQVGVEEILDQLVVFGTAVFLLDGHLGDRGHVFHHLRVVVAVGVVVDAAVDRLRDDAHLIEGVHEGVREAALRDVAPALAHVVVLQLVHVFLADDEHLRQVVGAFAHPEQFRFHERGGGETPAGAGRRLVLDRRCRYTCHFRELVALAKGGQATQRERA